MSRIKASIYMKSYQYEVVLPKPFVWPFMMAFGEFYKDLNGYIATIDNYHAHPNGWHVIVTVGHEKKFENFFKKFCEQKGIPFEETEY